MSTGSPIAVYGAGAWGTALAIAFAGAHPVRLWGRDAQQIAAMTGERCNTRYLPDVPFPAALTPTPDFATAARGAHLHLIVTPLSGLRTAVRELQRLAPGVPCLWACKGLEASSGKLPHQIVSEELDAATPVGVLTGPSFADEVARNMPTAITLASADRELIATWLPRLHQPTLRIYGNDDVVGAEVGGAIKNVMAIAAGVSDGLGYGLNARSALITRGLAEIARLAAALGGQPETLMGLAGMGDLILTCTGDLSRNRRVGLALAKGKTLDDILHELGHVAEGVSTAREVARMASRYSVEMPISEAVNAMLHHGVPARDVVDQLLSRDPRHE